MIFALLLLADASAISTGVWVTGAFAAAGGLSTIINLAALFATRREVEALEKRLNETRDELGHVRGELAEMERRLNANSETRAKDTHDRINEVLTAVSRLDGQVHPHK